jgi:hypothetical protein
VVCTAKVLATIEKRLKNLDNIDRLRDCSKHACTSQHQYQYQHQYQCQYHLLAKCASPALLHWLQGMRSAYTASAARYAEGRCLLSLSRIARAGRSPAERVRHAATSSNGMEFSAKAANLALSFYNKARNTALSVA